MIRLDVQGIKDDQVVGRIQRDGMDYVDLHFRGKRVTEFQIQATISSRKDMEKFITLMKDLAPCMGLINKRKPKYSRLEETEDLEFEALEEKLSEEWANDLSKLGKAASVVGEKFRKAVLNELLEVRGKLASPCGDPGCIFCSDSVAYPEKESCSDEGRVSGDTFVKCGCGGNLVPTEEGLVCDICG